MKVFSVRVGGVGRFDFTNQIGQNLLRGGFLMQKFVRVRDAKYEMWDFEETWEGVFWLPDQKHSNNRGVLDFHPIVSICMCMKRTMYHEHIPKKKN